MKQPNTSYLKQISGRRGFYFQRAVPVPLQKSIGKKVWTYKAGDSITDARRNVVRLLAETDALIAQHKGEVNKGLLESLNHTSRPARTGRLGPEDLFPRFNEDEQHELYARVVALSQGKTPKGRTLSDLIDLNTRLKKPAAGTRREWLRYVRDLSEVTGKDDVADFTKADAQAFRDHLLDNVAPSTAKTRLSYLAGLFALAEEEEWIENSPSVASPNG